MATWMEAGVDGAIEEVGESSSPPRGIGHGSGGGIAACDIKDEIFARLMEDGIEEVVSNPHYKDQLNAHFNRLPAR